MDSKNASAGPARSGANAKSRLLVAQMFLPDTPVFGQQDEGRRSSSHSSSVESGFLSASLTPANGSTSSSILPDKSRSMSIVDDLTMRNNAGRASPMSQPRHNGSSILTPLSPATPTASESSDSDHLSKSQPTLVQEPQSFVASPPTLPRIKSSSAVNRMPPFLSPLSAAMTPANDRAVGATITHHHRERPAVLEAVKAPAVIESVRPMQKRESTSGRSTRIPPPATSLQKMRRRRSSSMNRVREDTHPVSGTPFRLETNSYSNGGLNNAVNSVAEQHGEVIWIGTPGCDVNEWDRRLKRDVERRYLSEKQSLPVFVADETLEAGYSGFCKQILWYLCHYSLNEQAVSRELYQGNPTTEKLWWTAYQQMNQAIALRIIEAYRPGDVIWINGYHLMLCSAQIRAELPNATIGFFLHIAFPSSELFRCLAQRVQLLRGMLGADLVGLQTFQHARHFRITVARLLGYETSPRGVQLEERFVAVDSIPIGLDVRALRIKAQSEDVIERYDILKKRYDGLKLLVSRDKLDYVRGVDKKLLGFERFLELHPEWVGRVCLIQIATASPSQNEVQSQIGKILTRINSRWATLVYQPVVFLHQEIPFSQYLALLKAADVFVSASLREGMNLTSHEYVVLQESHHGPLVLSEFTGAYTASTFQSSLPCNPWDLLSISSALYTALTMSPEEAEERWRALSHDVSKQTAQRWTSSFVQRTKQAALEARQPVVLRTDPAELATALVPIFKSAVQPLLLLDLEGALFADASSFEARQAALGAKELLSLLQRLSTRATVYLLSSYGSNELGKLTGQLPGVGCVSENGCEIQLAEEEDWQDQTVDLDLSWRDAVLENLRYYTERTPGSFVEDRGTLVVWHYCPADVAIDSPEYVWPRRQATDASNGIVDALGEKLSLQIVNEARSITISPRKVSRGTAASFILSDHGENAFDLILAVSADEHLLRFLRRLKESGTMGASPPQIECIGVGNHEERFVAGPAEAKEVLRRLITVS